MIKIRVLISVAVIGLFVILLSTTNPNKEEYLSWFNEEAMQKNDNILESGAVFVMNKVGVFEGITTSSNYLLFSIYNTKLTDNRNIVVLGLFNNFIQLK